ncbi:hypothetical protein [Nocardia sp. alder85J]|uniref:hypothetical protein n=1 Tax=Nocardia sp. alder85J TaxID=2862949 RepID=UPI001CD1ABE2|nr:hypothetical protein [Nocardia sp. alder85J]MCX4097017.1 hypothetical protein [Nocardia sp. alder85J]
MTIEHPVGDEVTHLARRVEKARGRLAYQFDPALTEALSEDELSAERQLAEKIRVEEREQRWRHVQALSEASNHARKTSQEIAKADMRDLLIARKAIAAQRRESSPHAKLASLYRHRSMSLRALAGVVAAGMLWSAVNVQHNIAPGGPSDPLYWFSYLLEAMISVCLVIIMVGTNKVAEWGIIDSRRQVAFAEGALLALTVGLNTYPYMKHGDWYDVSVHAVAPVMIGVALLIHHAASSRYGLAIARATEQVRDMPDPADQIRRSMPTFVSFLRPNGGSDPAAQERPLAALPAEATPAEPAAKVRSTRNDSARNSALLDMDDEPNTDSIFAVAPARDTSGKTNGNGNGKSNGARPSKPVDDGNPSTDSFNIYDTGQFRIADSLEQELAELRAERRKARKNRDDD